MTPIQTTVLAYVNDCVTCAHMTDMCKFLESSTRYVGYALERAALELVEQGVLVQEGNLLMVADAL